MDDLVMKKVRNGWKNSHSFAARRVITGYEGGPGVCLNEATLCVYRVIYNGVAWFCYVLQRAKPLLR
jgi:hypothetical protein